MKLPRLLRRAFKILMVTVLCAAIAGAVAWQARRMYLVVKPQQDTAIPTTAVKSSDITMTVSAKGELKGGNSEMLSAPLTSGGDLHLTMLRTNGEIIKANEVVVQFDTTNEEFKLQEAESDLAEAKMKVQQAKAQAGAQLEEDTYSVEAAESAVKLAELDMRKNPILPAIQVRQNELALKAAQDRLTQIRQDIGSRKETNQAAINVQDAGVQKAEVAVATAKHNIDALTLKSHRDGYVSIRQNTSGNFFMEGMTLPFYQVGDTVRAGMAVAEIPDLKNWELTATIGELDRGHLAIGQNVDVSVIALPGHKFHGHVKDLGGTGGPPWDRHFECRMRLDDPTTELRPGMSVRIVITTETLAKALWIPAQALFESGGRTYVYIPSPSGFIPQDVKLLRRSESQVVLSGLKEGQLVALANPEQQVPKKPATQATPLPK